MKVPFDRYVMGADSASDGTVSVSDPRLVPIEEVCRFDPVATRIRELLLAKMKAELDTQYSADDPVVVEK